MLSAFILLAPLCRASGQIPVEFVATGAHPSMFFHEDANGYPHWGQTLDCSSGSCPLDPNCTEGPCPFTTNFNDVLFTGTGAGQFILFSTPTSHLSIRVSQNVTFNNPNAPQDATVSGDASAGFGGFNLWANVAPNAQVIIQVVDNSAVSWSNAGVTASYEVDISRNSQGQTNVCASWGAMAPNLWPNVLNGTGSPTDVSTTTCSGQPTTGNLYNGMYGIAVVNPVGGQISVTNLSPVGSFASYSFNLSLSVFVNGPVMQITGGDAQTGLVGTALPQPLTVSVVDDQTGAPMSGMNVTFGVVGPDGVTSGGAFSAPASSTTDSTGTAGTILTLGNSTGTYTVTANCSQCMGNVVKNFTETATQPTMQAASTQFQIARPGKTLPIPWSVRVIGPDGSPVQASVQFSISAEPANGTDAGLSSLGGQTVGGLQSTTLTLGSDGGTYEVTAFCPACASGQNTVKFSARTGTRGLNSRNGKAPPRRKDVNTFDTQIGPLGPIYLCPQQQQQLSCQGRGNFPDRPSPHCSWDVASPQAQLVPSAGSGVNATFQSATAGDYVVGATYDPNVMGFRPGNHDSRIIHVRDMKVTSIVTDNPQLGILLGERQTIKIGFSGSLGADPRKFLQVTVAPVGTVNLLPNSTIIEGSEIRFDIILVAKPAPPTAGITISATSCGSQQSLPILTP